jgi:hypothetical protein
MTELETSAPRTREAAGRAAPTQRSTRPAWDRHKVVDARPQVGTR